MADNYFPCIIGAMDGLWFHQIILFSESEPTPSLVPKSIRESLTCASSILSLPNEEETSTDESPSPPKQVTSQSICTFLQFYCHKDNSIDNEEEEEKKEVVPKRTNLLGNRIRSHSSSPSIQYRSRKFRKLHRSMSCRTRGEIELQEVKGYMNIVFIFKTENLSPRMISIVPGLQRLGILQYQNKQNTQLTDGTETVRHNDCEGEEENRDMVMRPYLSEAWLIRRPDSPLLNRQLPKLCSVSDMKKHIRCWAKTLASEIHQQ